MNGQISKKRSLSIDMIKGLSILSLAFNHIEENWLNTDYNYFIVRSQAFFIVVGWLWGMSSNRRTIREHWEKRKKGLVIPYLWFSLIFIIIDILMLIFNWIEPFVLYRDLYKTLCLRGIGTLWFLPALLGGELLFIYLRDGSWSRRIFAIICSFVVICYYDYWINNATFNSNTLKDIVNAPFCVIEKICNAYIYISIAYYFSKCFGKKIFNGKKRWLLLGGIVSIIFGFICMNFVELPLIQWNAFFITTNFIIGCGVICLFRSIETMTIISQPLSYYGKNSLIVMAMHWPIYQLAIAFDHNILGHQVYGGKITMFYYVSIVILLIGIIELINRKLPYIIGK